MTRAELTQLIMSVDASGPAEPMQERAAQALDAIQSLAELLKDAKAMIEERLLEWIEEHDGQDITIGPIRYYAGVKKTTKCRDKAATLNAALTLAGGDMEAAGRDYMASEPFKHGALRKALEENPVADFRDLFETVEEPELKEGKPTKRLQKIDQRFLR